MNKLFFLLILALVILTDSLAAQGTIVQEMRRGDVAFAQNFNSNVDTLEKLISRINEQYNQKDYAKAKQTANKILALSPNNKIAQDILNKIKEEEIIQSPAFTISKELKIKELLGDADNFAENNQYDSAMQYYIEVLHLSPENKPAAQKMMALLYSRVENRIDSEKMKAIERAAAKKAAVQSALLKKRVRQIQDKPAIVKSYSINVTVGKRFVVMLDTTEDIGAKWAPDISDTINIVQTQKTFFPPIDNNSMGKVIYQFIAQKQGAYSILFRTTDQNFKPIAVGYNINARAAEMPAAESKAHPLKSVAAQTKLIAPVKTEPAAEKAGLPVSAKYTAEEQKIRYARTYLDNGFYDEALKILNKIAADKNAADTDKQNAYMLIAKNYELKGEDTNALTVLSYLTKTYPNSSVAQQASLAEADLFSNMGNYVNAMRSLIAAKVEGPDNNISAKASFRLAQLFSALSQYSDAAREYKEIINKYPSSEYEEKALLNIANIYETKLKDFVSAYNSYSQLLRKYPQNPKTDFIKSKISEIKNNYL